MKIMKTDRRKQQRNVDAFIKKVILIFSVLLAVITITNIVFTVITNDIAADDYLREKEDFLLFVKDGNFSEALEIWTVINGNLSEDKEFLSALSDTMIEIYDSYYRLGVYKSKLPQSDYYVYCELSSYVNIEEMNFVIDNVYADYIQERISYSEFSSLMDDYKVFFNATGYRPAEASEKAFLVWSSRNRYETAEELFYGHEYKEAVDEYLEVIEEDDVYYKRAFEKIEICRIRIKEEAVATANELASNGLYTEACMELEDAADYFPGDETLGGLLEKYRGFLNLVEYDGPIRHAFVHSLIVYPELAFDGDGQEQGFNYWMTTVLEMKRILNLLYENDYILIDMDSLIAINEIDGNAIIRRKNLMLPEGKKPIILSIDDLAYNSVLDGNGFADKLVIDENGEVATLVYAPDGSSSVTRDGDLIPLLDDFIKKHPDFSLDGAKGIIAFTGYEGILGYDTHLKNSPSYNEEVAKAEEVIDRLLETGWKFASHSYTHDEDFKDGEFDFELLKYDTEKWAAEVLPLIGPVNIYISPFGYRLPAYSSEMQYLRKNGGFTIFCGVGGNEFATINNGIFLQDRIDFDGFKMTYRKEYLDVFFDADSVIDRRRPLFPELE